MKDYLETLAVLTLFTVFVLVCANGIGPISPGDQLVSDYQSF